MRKVLMLVLSMSFAMMVKAQKDISLDGSWALTINGKDYTVSVPHTYNVMALVLKNINAQYNFEVFRSNGFSVIEY